MVVDEVVLRDEHAALHDAFDAPDPRMIVEGSLLARSPGHHDDRVASRRIAMEQPSRVRVGQRRAELRIQRKAVAAQDLLQCRFHVLRDDVRVPGLYRLVEMHAQRVEVLRGCLRHDAASMAR
jgi:hypothetical protein